MPGNIAVKCRWVRGRQQQKLDCLKLWETSISNLCVRLHTSLNIPYSEHYVTEFQLVGSTVLVVSLMWDSEKSAWPLRIAGCSTIWTFGGIQHSSLYCLQHCWIHLYETCKDGSDQEASTIRNSSTKTCPAPSKANAARTQREGCSDLRVQVTSLFLEMDTILDIYLFTVISQMSAWLLIYECRSFASQILLTEDILANFWNSPGLNRM